MNISDSYSYLGEPHVSILVTMGSNGYPLMTPVWHLFENNAVWITSKKSSQKVKNLLSNPHVALCVTNDERPHKYVSIQGNSEVVQQFDIEFSRRYAFTMTVCKKEQTLPVNYWKRKRWY